MKNKLPDLNNHLFAQLERLGDEDLQPAQIATEAKRANAMVAVSREIIQGAALQLKAAQVITGIDGRLVKENFTMIDKPKDFTVKPGLSHNSQPSDKS